MYWYRSSYTYTSSPQSYSYDPIGGCGVYQDALLKSISDSASNAAYVGCTTAANALNSAPMNGVVEQTITKFKLEPSPSTSSAYTIYSRTFRRTLTLSNGVYTEDASKRQYLSPTDATGNGYQANVTLTKNSNQTITAIAWSGDMASSYDDTGAVLGKKHVVHLNVSVSGPDVHTQRLAMTGDISLVNGSDGLISKLSLDTGSHVIVSDNNNGQDAMSMQFTLSVPRWVISGQLIGTAYVIDKSGLYAPTNVEFNGSVKDSGTEFFKGSITGVISNYANYDSSKPEAADNFTPATTQVKGTVSIPNRPKLSVTLSGNSSAYGVGSASLVYTQGTDPSVTLTASRTADRPTIKNYTFNNSQGIAMRWNSTDSQADLTKNDVTLGTWNFNTGRLTFTNGQFVQF